MTKLHVYLAAVSVSAALFTTSANAALIEYDFNISTAGSGVLIYDDIALDIDQLSFDFGAFGSSNVGPLDASTTSSIFGAPPGSALNNDNIFFGLSGGTAYGLRFSADGTFCVRPDADYCEDKGGTAPDMISGTYNIAVSSVPVPAAAWLFSSGLLGLIGLGRLRRSA